MSNCSTGCPTQDHVSYGQCMKSKGLRTGVQQQSQSYQTGNRFWTEIKEYRAARAQGIQPKSSKLEDIRSAVSRSVQTNTAVQDLG
jgi:hypothetical protein